MSLNARAALDFCLGEASAYELDTREGGRTTVRPTGVGRPQIQVRPGRTQVETYCQR